MSSIKQNPEKAINSIISTLKERPMDLNASISGVFVTGDKYFTRSSDYEGKFKSLSGNVGRFKGSYAKADHCKAYSIGGTVKRGLGISVNWTWYTMIYCSAK